MSSDVKTYKLLKFIGKFSELEFNGFVFDNFNHRFWSKEVTKSRWIWVYKARREVEVQGLYEWSGVVAEYMRAHPNDLTTTSLRGGPGFLKFAIKRQTGELEVYDNTKHNDFFYYCRENQNAIWKEISGEVSRFMIPDITVAEFEELYDVVSLKGEMIVEICSMFDKGWLEVVEVEDFSC